MERLWNSPIVLLLRSALWTLLLPGVVVGYIPWQVFGLRFDHLAHARAIVGIAVSAAGLIILLICIAEFARRGKGTLSPVDPPRHLVVTGLYRWVRNPMYFGVLLVLVGEVLVSDSRNLALYTLIFFVCVNLFVLGFEEPYLARSFGLSYADYKKHVGRWIPRITPWRPS